jgi:dynein heavy chain
MKLTEEEFGPLQEHFLILEKYEVEVKEDVQQLLETLPTTWDTYQQGLIESEKALTTSKKQFKQGLMQATEELGRNVVTMRNNFLDRGPFSSEVVPTDALNILAQYKQEIASIHERSAALKSGLKVFELSDAPYPEVVDTEKDIGFLEQLWTVARDWQELYSEWKVCEFSNIQTDQMEQGAQGQLKKLIRVAREVKDKDWEFVALYKKRIEQFRRVLPLVVDLKNPAMRPRHWKQISAEVNIEINPTQGDLTLGLMIDYGLDQFAEQISSISGAASKELSIEQTLASIEATWSTTSMDIGPYKDRGHFVLKGTEEIFLALEDNQVTLSTMKASRFVKAFETEVDKWERALSLILEVVETVLNVQRQWMYLENIFLGEDIRKQLPMESNKFDQVNDKWKVIMTGFHKDPNAKRATHTENLLQTLNNMNTVLEQIQKSLNMYLETKRQIFPRFYFVSDDDLLEMLGQSRNPQAIQPHLLKCFDNIKSLDLQTQPGRRNTEAVGMYSAEGELVPFQNNVVLDGPVEDWLGRVETEMRATLRVLMVQCIASHKKLKREKWIKDCAGQLVLTVSQLSWTADCVKVLSIKDSDRGGKKGIKVLKKKQV